MLNKIEIDNDSRTVHGVTGQELYLSFSNVEEVFEDYNYEADGEDDIKLDRMIVRGVYIYNYTLGFEQHYKFEFWIDRDKINGTLNIPMPNERDLEISLRTKDENGWDRWEKGYLPKWNSIELTIPSLRTDEDEDITRFMRGVKIARHLSRLVESWKALKSVADLEAHKKYMKDKKNKKDTIREIMI
mgnify:CR=1 FL=1